MCLLPVLEVIYSDKKMFRKVTLIVLKRGLSQQWICFKNICGGNYEKITEDKRSLMAKRTIQL